MRGNAKSLWRKVHQVREVGRAMDSSSGQPRYYWNPLGRRAREAEEAWTYDLSPDDLQRYKRNKRQQNKKRAALNALGRGPLPATATNPIVARTARSLTRSALDRAKVLNVPFSLDIRWVYHKVLAGRCELTGLSLDVAREFSPGEGLRSNFGPSLDRNVPELGYTPENCRIVVWAYNAAKGSGTDEEIALIAEAIVKRRAQLIDG